MPHQRAVHPRQRCFEGSTNIQKIGLIVLSREDEIRLWSFNVGEFSTGDIAPLAGKQSRSMRIQFSHQGTGAFEVKVRSAKDASLIEALVTTMGQFQGSRAVTIDQPVYLEIFATGSWTVQIL